MVVSALRDTRDVLTDALGTDHPLVAPIDDFLTDLRNAGRSRNTIKAYRGDLIMFARHHHDELAALTVAPVRAYLSENIDNSAATRSRRRSAVKAFCAWAVRQELLEANPVDKTEAVTVPKGLPRPAPYEQVHKLLNTICARRPRKDVPIDVLRDRVLFELAYVCGARAAEVCGAYVEDLDLRVDNEHITLHGKGDKTRVVLLDDRGFVALLRLYLQRTGYTNGPLFRPTINGGPGPISYNAVLNRWIKYRTAAGVDLEIHQLRHAHAMELMDSGVSLEVIRRRLGHAKTETTQIYAQARDELVDNEIRAARRRRDAARR
ncbi:tyrosine-type recombinase/integrase [Nocardia sp. IFM 10818]